MLQNKIIVLRTLVIRVCQIVLNIFSHWISKPCTQNHKNHTKANSGARRFSQSLCACKKSQYNIRNCKSRRHNRSHTFRGCNSQPKSSSTDIPYNWLKVKGRKNGKTKTPHPRSQNQMLYTINLYQNNILCESTKMRPVFLHFDGPNL